MDAEGRMTTLYSVPVYCHPNILRTGEICTVRPTHIGPVAADLDEVTTGFFDQIGVRPRRGLRQLISSSSYSRVALLDGRPLALWGLLGTDLATAAEPWLSLT